MMFEIEQFDDERAPRASEKKHGIAAVGLRVAGARGSQLLSENGSLRTPALAPSHLGAG